MKRRDARELAFTLLFEQSFNNTPMKDLILSAEATRSIKLDEFAMSLCLLAWENQDATDEKISRHATRWNVGRLPRVTLTLLRMCIAEMDFIDDVPVSVSINEAVELCKKYAGDEDAAFLNGVLGAYANGEKAEIDLPTPPEMVLDSGSAGAEELPGM